MRVWIGVSVIVLALAAVAETQELDSLVSPGALSHVHSELAGLTNCNALGFDPVTGLPLLVRIPDRRTLSNDLFFALSPSVGVSFEYEYSAQGGPNENAVFFRFIYRL